MTQNEKSDQTNTNSHLNSSKTKIRNVEISRQNCAFHLEMNFQLIWSWLKFFKSHTSVQAGSKPQTVCKNFDLWVNQKTHIAKDDQTNSNSLHFTSKWIFNHFDHDSKLLHLTIRSNRDSNPNLQNFLRKRKFRFLTESNDANWEISQIHLTILRQKSETSRFSVEITHFPLQSLFTESYSLFEIVRLHISIRSGFEPGNVCNNFHTHLLISSGIKWRTSRNMLKQKSLFL